VAPSPASLTRPVVVADAPLVGSPSTVRDGWPSDGIRDRPAVAGASPTFEVDDLHDLASLVNADGASAPNPRT